MSQLCFNVFKAAKLSTHPFYIHVVTFVSHAGGSIKASAITVVTRTPL